MKKFLGTLMLAFLTASAFAQPTKSPVQGTVTESGSSTPIAGATISLGSRQSVTDENGKFVFTNPALGRYELLVSSLGHKPYRQDIDVKNSNAALSISLTPSSLYLQPLEVRSVRASDKAPFTKTNITKEQIAKNNFGQDVPFLLDQTPSVVVNSDAGNGIGYTGIRIRGSDATRVNVTLNGIPYNDAESMGSYFVDLPDIASSVNSIQIQRGIGTSSNGAGAFGGTINLATNEYNEKAYAESNNSFGSFNTWKNTLKAGSGLIGDHFTVDARLSRINSDGFIDRAKSDLKSFYFSTAYLNKKSSLRLNIFSGKEKTYQAWYGVPENKLQSDRSYNPAGTEKTGAPYDNQTDNYTQTHYQLFFNHSFSSSWSFNTAVFLTRGKGYYEEYKAQQSFTKYGLPASVVVGGTTYTQTDIVRQRWLDNYFYGQILSLQYKNKNDEFTFGGGWTVYDGKHYGTIAWLQYGTVPANHRYYDYPAKKTDVNVYTKWQHRIDANWTSFADLQYRYVKHDMNGFEDNPNLYVSRDFDFINPKAGITYAKNGWQTSISYALGRKEPNRDDFQAGITTQPKAETMHDIEAGVEKRTAAYHFGATVYYMYYINQLVLTGQINDVGSYTRKNIPHSYRLGIELQAAAVVNKWMNVAGNLTLSRNKIASYTEYIDNYDNGGQDEKVHRNTDISFSPPVTAAATLSFIPVRNVELSFISKYVGKEYMDNSQDETRKLNAFFVQNIRASWTFKKLLFSEWNITGMVNNVFNKRYEPNGYTYSYVSGGSVYTDNGYFPMAGTNYVLGVNIRL
ncbi:TonB-dependent receptor [Sediminibacterium roseum]|uniref:TonB-dependent receptor n=1 Tax=Sediminibacterium roseum TaxID=1978412 RepID=A0ABW9ZXJ5_9BACT|nr:TonB-dependent receptor [Sediminibacterium roseum]NCI49745.1 TonB-dependent receptor [Sediminibacterium roseum]